MEGQLVVPFHFAAEFLILAVAAGACLDAIRRVRSGGGARALSQAAGFALLAAAQVVHGVRIPGAAEDGALVLIILRAIGFALIAAGGFPGPRFVPRDGAVVMPGVALPLAVAGLFQAGNARHLALIPAVAAAAAFVRGIAAHRSDQDPASFAYSAAFATFAGGELALAMSGPDGGSALALAHVLRFVAALLLVRWLAVTIARSVRLRFVSAFVVALTVLVLVLSASFDVVIARNVEREELNRAGVVASSLSGAIDRQVRSDQQTVFNLAQAAQGTLPGRAGVSALACLYSDLDMLMAIERSGRVVGSALKPGKRCDFADLSRYVAANPSPVVPQALRLGVAGSLVVTANALSGRSNGSLEIVRPATLAIVAAAPVGSVARPAGALAVGRIVASGLIDRLRAGDFEVIILIGGRVAALSTPVPKEKRRAELQQAISGDMNRRIRRDVEENGGMLNATLTVAGARTFTSFVPLNRSNGDTIAVLGIVSNAGDVRASREALNRILFLIALIAALVAAFIAAIAGGHVTSPIRALTIAAEAVRRGDLSARAPAAAPDELGELGRSFNEMAASLDRSTADLRAAALTEGELRSRMEAIMQSMADGLIATDRKGVVVIVNRAAEDLTGLTAVKMLGAKIDAVVRGADASGRAIAEGAMAEPGSFSATLERGDVRVPVAITTAPLVGEGDNEAGRVILLRDVSAEVQAERMKSEFLSNVSHELRTPLTPIKGYTEILKRKKFSKDKAETFLDGILESTSRLERIVEILVDFAAMEAGRLKPQTEPVALKPFVDELVGRWKGRSDGRFTVKVAAGVPSVNADPRLLAKSLDELIDNAVKFSPDGVRVEIEAMPSMNGTRKRASKITIAVRDHGIGIAKEMMPSLFRDFQQIDGSETREFGGLGLGLAYVKRIATVHGGEVSAQSALGKGSTFTLTLPAADSKDTASAAKKKAARAPAKATPAKRRTTETKP